MNHFQSSRKTPRYRTNKDKSKKNSLKILIITGVVLIIIIIIIIFLLEAGNVLPIGGGDKHKDTYTALIDGKNVTFYSSNLIKKDKTISTGTYKSTLMDDTVFLVVDGATLTLENSVKKTKTGKKSLVQKLLSKEESSEKPGGYDDQYSFFGINSAIVVIGKGSKAIINGVTINTDSFGSNAIEEVDSGEVTISNSTIGNKYCCSSFIRKQTI